MDEVGAKIGQCGGDFLPDWAGWGVGAYHSGMNTSPSLVDELLAHLQDGPLQQLAQQLGADPAQTQNAISTALPMLLGALGQNSTGLPAEGASTGQGLDLGGLLGSVLGGGHAPGTESGGNTGPLLQLLAPIVMSFLAQRGNAENIGNIGNSANADGADAGGLGGGLGGGLLGKLLDQDGDGQVGLSDFLKIGENLLGGRR